jgi:hypothetical protein
VCAALAAAHFFAADTLVPGATELARAPTALTNLRLHEPSIPDDCWPRLLAAPWASRLCRFWLLRQPLGTRGGASGEGLRALAGAPLPALADLETAKALLTPADLSGTLAAAPWLGQLTRLKFANEQLGAAGLAALASLRLPRLQSLILDNVCTTEDGLVALGAAPWLTQLTRLRVMDVDYDGVWASYRELGEVVDVQACEAILEGRGSAEGNPFAPLARAGAIETYFY